MKVPNYSIGCITQLTDKGVQQTVDVFGDVMTRAVNVQAAQMEAGVRAKLIELGWTPPRYPAMTTTHDVPMPEPDSFLHNLAQDPLYGPTKLRAYADARCAKLQEERDELQRQNDEILARNVELDKAMGALEAERDALAENVKALQDDARRYRWLRTLFESTTSTTGRPMFRCYWMPGCVITETSDQAEMLDAAIDAAGDQP